MARCCRPRLLLFALLAAVGFYGWYGALLLLLGSDDTTRAGAILGATTARAKGTPDVSGLSSVEMHRLSDAEALAAEKPEGGEDGEQGHAGVRQPQQQPVGLKDREWLDCGAQLLDGPARRQYAAAAALAVAAAPEAEVIFSLVTSSPPHTVRRTVQNLLAFTTERSWVVVHLGKFPAVPYDKRDLDYRWLLAQDRVRINDVRLGITARHGSELWAHMHNYRVVRERQQLQPSRQESPQVQSFFVFASELQTVLRPGLERWISERQASIPEAGVPIVLPGQAALFEDVTRWHEIRPASWEPQGSFYPLSVVGRFYDFLLADSQIYTTLFHEREDSAQYWLQSYITIWEGQWLQTLKRRPNDVYDGTDPIVGSVGSQSDICRAPTCDKVRAVVLASTRGSTKIRTGTASQQTGSGGEGVYGVSFGRSALSPSCSSNGDSGPFDMVGYENLIGALGSEAKQEIDQSGPHGAQQLHSPPQSHLAGTASPHGGGAHKTRQSNVAGGGDETR